MSVSNADHPASSAIFRRTVRVILKSLLVLFLLVGVLILLVQTPYVQDIARKKVTKYLSNKWQTKVTIGKIYIDFPQTIELRNIYVEDRHKDTLVSGGFVKANINMWKLIHNDISIYSLRLENMTVKLIRALPDTSYNFQFILDAFKTTNQIPTVKKDTSQLKMALRFLQLEKVRFVYKDIVSGSDLQVWFKHAIAKTDVFNPSALIFDASKIELEGISAKIRQSQPLNFPDPDPEKILNEKKSGLQLTLHSVVLNDVFLDYSNEQTVLYTQVQLGNLIGKVKKFDLNKRLIDIDEIQINKSIADMHVGKQTTSEIAKKKVNDLTADSINSVWHVRVGAAGFNDNQFRYDDDARGRVSKGVDLAHLDVDKFSFNVRDFLFNKDSISGNIKEASFKEQSGLILTNLKSNFHITNNQALFKDLLLTTPGTILKRSILITYPTKGTFKEQLAKAEVDIDLQQSKIQLKDILTFAPSLNSNGIFSNPDDFWFINTRMKGNRENLKIDLFQFRGLQNTRIDFSGTLKNIEDIHKADVDLILKEVSSGRRDLAAFIESKNLPKKIEIPEQFRLAGTMKGSTRKLFANLKMSSNVGDLRIKGYVQDITDSKNTQYDANVALENLHLGKILKDTSLGRVSASFMIKGAGFTPDYANAKVKGIVQSVIVRNYAYHDINLVGNIAQNHFNASTSIQDPNIQFSLLAEGNVSNRYPALKFTLDIDSIKTLPLHLTKDNFFYRGKISADFLDTDPDNLEGDLFVTQSLLVRPGMRVLMDSIRLNAGKTDSGRYVKLTSDAVKLLLSGKYKLTQLESVVDQAIDPYFATKPSREIIKVDPYDFRIAATVIDRPVLRAILPNLKQLQTVSLQSRFTSTNGWNAFINAPLIINGTDEVHNLKIEADGKQSILAWKLSFAQLKRGSGLRIYSTILSAGVSNNKVDFSLVSRDKGGKNKYRVAGLFQQIQTGEYAFSIKPDSLMLNYDSWNINSGNKILVSKNGVNVNTLELRKKEELLKIRSNGLAINSPVDIGFTNFKLSTLTGFVRPDSLMVDGILDGQAAVGNVMQQLSFTSDLTLRDFVMNKDTIGIVHFKVSNVDANTLATNINLSGRGNDVQVVGNYYLKPVGNNSFDFTIDMRSLTLKSMEAVGPQFIRDASGSLNGKISFKGDFANPSINGSMVFNKARFNLEYANNYFSIDQQKIEFNKDGIHFNDFTINDSSNNTAVLNGIMYTGNFRDFKNDLTLRVRNFYALNTTKKDNKLYYGQLYFNAFLRVKGTETTPIIDGNIIINDGTRMTAVLPQNEPGIENREGIVQFVQMNAAANDSIFLAPYDSTKASPLVGIDASVNIEIKKEAELNLIVDEGNGDFLKMKGEGSLNAGIDQSGKITLTGSYELDEGAYELSFNYLKRKFVIEKGSKITWKGDPLDADVDIVATYIATTAPLDLVENQLASSSTTERNIYLQKLPFEVSLKMSGQLLKPQIAFDVLLPDNKNYNVSKDIVATVNDKLTLLRQEPSELNKQVFALLLLNRFVRENPFQTTSSGITAESFARASVSKLFTEQLNQLAADLVKGVDLNFDVVSQNDDYTTGNRQSRTDLNVALSKRLLSDQLTVTVGSNFELEGAPNTNRQATNIAGNVALDYKISKDGRYLLRVYRKNDYLGVLDGYVIETGVGFIMTVDYNKFNEIFLSQKQRQKMRAERRAGREKTAIQNTGGINK